MLGYKGVSCCLAMAGASLLPHPKPACWEVFRSRVGLRNRGRAGRALKHAPHKALHRCRQPSSSLGTEGTEEGRSMKWSVKKKTGGEELTARLWMRWAALCTSCALKGNRGWLDRVGHMPAHQLGR